MISVCMATYNGEFYIKQQIDSILSQLSDDDELIVSDDGSTDNTLNIILAYNDSRIIIFNHEKNSHLKKSKFGRNFIYVKDNFENAIRHAKGDVIFLTDQDDIWMKNKVATCLTLLNECDCVVHNYTIIDKDNKIIKNIEFKKKPIHRTVMMNCVDNHFRGCCMAFKASFLKYVLPIPKNVIGHDYWIGTIISHYGKIRYDMKPLIQSRWYPESVSAKRKTSLWYKLEFRITLYIETIKRIIKCKVNMN